MKLVHVISHLVFCTELLGWMFFVLLPEKSGLKARGVQGNFSWLVLPKLALLCVSYSPQIYITIWFLVLFQLHSNHKCLQGEKKTPTTTLWSRLTFVSAALFFSMSSITARNFCMRQYMEKFRLLISCYRSGWAIVHKPAVIFHIDSTQILFV